MPGRNKSKKFLKQKQGNQKKRSKFQVKSPEAIANNDNIKTKSMSDLSVHTSNVRTDRASASSTDMLDSFDYDNVATYDAMASISDSISIAPSVMPSTSSLSNDAKISNVSEVFDEQLENLEEKDAIMRQTTLHRINHLLRENSECDEYLQSKSCEKLERLASCLRDSLHRGDASEQIVALETISLLSFSLQRNHAILTRAVSSSITKLIETPQSDQTQTQIESLKTLTRMAWISGEASKKSSTINLLQDIWQQRAPALQTAANDTELQNVQNAPNGLQSTDTTEHGEMEPLELLDPSETSEEAKSDEADEAAVAADGKEAKREIALVVAALESWAWLVASIGSGEDIGSLLEGYYKELLHILEHQDSVELRCAAGEALTLLVSNYTRGNDVNEVDIDFDEIDAAFYEMSEESDIKRKNELKEQKQRFRWYWNTLETGWNPAVKIKLRGAEHEITGWAGWIEYNRVKNVLKQGLQMHLLKNENVRTALGIDGLATENKQDGKKVKLMMHADNGKQQKRKIQGKRQKKQAFMFDHSGEI